ncbi:MAG TPA: hypothetical protein DCQ90_05465 [Erysipelotrichaceae bacterium]|nr:hypothetical protein [Erysipelotrichaceae bacterium]
MEMIEFKNLCAKSFGNYGLIKRKKGYFMENDDFILSIFLQKSNFSMSYYINVGYSVKGYNMIIPDIKDETDQDFGYRIRFPYKDGTEVKYGYALKLKDFDTVEIEPYFDKAFEEWILPIFHGGKKEAISNINIHFGSPKNFLCLRKGLYEYLLEEAAK